MPRGSLVWDCACGNGQATVDLAKLFDRVVATDASKEQIASAKPHPKVEFRVAPLSKADCRNTVGPYWPPERKLVEGGYRTIPFPFAEITPPTFRMETRWTLDKLLDYFSTWSATNRFTKATGKNPLEPKPI